MPLIDQWMNFAGNSTNPPVTYGVNDFGIASTFLYTKGNAWIFLPGYLTAKNIFISGSFNNWSTSQTPMRRGKYGWTAEFKLEPGKYSYKFIVDGKWIPDPNNKLREKDETGIFNSIFFCYNHKFELKGHKDAQKVVVTGNFYNWNEGELQMNKTIDGWQLPYVIPAGNYEYKFIIDGKWITDPSNPFTTGTGNYTNSIVALRANHIFILNKFPEAKSVIITGSFNGWNKEGYHMIPKDGKWIFPISLSPGKYTYKFIVDGNWILDPLNSNYEQNEYDTKNSVLWVEP